MQRRASAQWRGGLKDGKGTVSTASGALRTVAYGFAMRFENEPGTNPEELVAAAHASCFAMAFSSELGKAGYRPDLIEVKATLDFDKADGGGRVRLVRRTAEGHPGNGKVRRFCRPRRRSVSQSGDDRSMPRT